MTGHVNGTVFAGEASRGVQPLAVDCVPLLGDNAKTVQSESGEPEVDDDHHQHAEDHHRTALPRKRAGALKGSGRGRNTSPQ